MAKLYEILTKKVTAWFSDDESSNQESKIWNPIGAKVGGSVSIDSLDYRGLNFFVKEIREYTVNLGGKKNRLVDYILLARPFDQEDVMVRLRLLPTSGDLKYKAVILHKYDEFAYDDGFLKNVLQDETKKFVVDEKDEHEEYWRVNDVGVSYKSKYLSLVDENNDGKVLENELSHGECEFWDYSRMTEIDSIEIEQFLFVEMNKEDGWFQLWRGSEVSAEKIDLI